MIRLIALLLCITIYGCENQQSIDNESIGKYGDLYDLSIEEELEIEPPRTAEAPSSPAEYELQKGSKIIKSGDMTFEVEQLEVVKSKVDSILLTSKGYYENEVFNAYGNRNTYSLTLRMPTSRFDSFVKILENGIGQLTSKNIRAKDVTEEYVDLNIRLDNNLSYLRQYKLILKKAKTIKEILNVQEKIRRIEEEIESKKGRLKYLDDKVKFSTLHLELSELTGAFQFVVF